jgi:hypothetical protein
MLNSYSTPVDDNLKDLRPILQAILRTNENLAAQNKALYQLLASGNTSSPWDLGAQGNSATDNYHARDSRLSRRSLNDHLNVQEMNTDIWEGILGVSAIQSNEFMQSFYYWPRPDRVEAVLNERRRWTSWSYAAAFPELSRFLKRATMSHRCCCQLWMDDLTGLGEKSRSISYSEAKRNINVLWDVIKNRAPLSSARQVRAGLEGEEVSVRLFQIVDLSPLVLAAILGSTPQ